MTGERVFCSRVERKVPTNVNLPPYRRERLSWPSLQNYMGNSGEQSTCTRGK
jgi:hypothetical protein